MVSLAGARVLARQFGDEHNGRTTQMHIIVVVSLCDDVVLHHCNLHVSVRGRLDAFCCACISIVVDRYLDDIIISLLSLIC